MAEEQLVNSAWEVAGIRDGERFFRALSQLLPATAYVVLEGTAIARDVRPFLQSVAVPPQRTIPVGTLWPRPTIYHLPASEAVLTALADLAARHAEPELCSHFHAYDDRRGLLQWYDAFDLPLLVDVSIPEDAIRSFCAAVGATCSPFPTG